MPAPACTYMVPSFTTDVLSTMQLSIAQVAEAEWMLADRVPARFQTQLHKHIWGADARGV